MKIIYCSANYLPSYRPNPHPARPGGDDILILADALIVYRAPPLENCSVKGLPAYPRSCETADCRPESEIKPTTLLIPLIAHKTDASQSKLRGHKN